jgi:hypothetical protein
MPIVNGHQAATGCVAAGHRGWYVGQAAIEEAQAFGFELDAEGQAAVERYYSYMTNESTPEEHSELFEIVVGQGGIVDEATEWLNDHTHGIRKRDGADVTWGEVEGEWFLADGTVVPEEQVQRFLWHWWEGEFFLSPYCGGDDPDCEDETCAHWE